MSKRPFAALALALVFCSAAIEAQRSTLRRPRAPVSRGSFEIVSCSLGCVPKPSLIGCGTTDIHVNEVLRITFNQRRVVVDLSPQVQDLGGNGIVNPGSTSFTTEAR